MNPIKDILRSASRAVQLVRQLLRYAVSFLWALFSPNGTLVARLTAAESRLAVCRGRIEQKRALPPRFRNLPITG